MSVLSLMSLTHDAAAALGFPSYGYVGGLEPRVSEDTRSRKLVNQMLAACMHGPVACGLCPIHTPHAWLSQSRSLNLRLGARHRSGRQV